MKKVFFLVTALLVITSSFAAFEIKSSDSKKATEIILPLGADTKISLMDLSTISIKDFEKLTGKHLGFFNRMAFKGVQKKIRKSINTDGTINNKRLLKFVDGDGGGKSQLTAALLCFFLGGLGIHRFYLGYTWQGIVQILTLGGLGIWVLIDFIRILTGSLKPKNSEYEKTL